MIFGKQVSTLTIAIVFVLQLICSFNSVKVVVMFEINAVANARTVTNISPIEKYNPTNELSCTCRAADTVAITSA
jgi:hypothetical protein